MSRSPITTHILDTARGCPAAGVSVILESMSGDGEEKNGEELGRGVTNDDGRVTDLLTPDHTLAPGVYRLTFQVAGYFKKIESSTFFPFVQITFEVVNPDQHYHVPLLLSPFGYSTYRGS